MSSDMGGVVLVEVHLDEPSAVFATEHTLCMLPGGGTFERDSDGNFVRTGDMYRLLCSRPGFIVFAIERQGYAKSARIE